jgi:hypothetical protein
VFLDYLGRVALTVLVVAGCTPVNSSRLETSSLYAEFRAGLGADGVGITAELQTGSGVSDADVRLSASDRFVAYVGEQSFPMKEDTCDRCVPGQVPPHVALLPASAATAQIRIALERGDGVSAPQSFVRLPASHDIVSPPAGMFSAASPASRARTRNITVTWAPTAADDTVDVNVAGCESNFANHLAAGSTQFSFDLGRLTPAVATEMCDVYFQVTLSREGIVDPAYGKGGRFIAARERDAVVTTGP